MAQIGEISTVVTAKTAPFSRGMSRAKGEAKGFGKSVKKDVAGSLKKSAMPALNKRKSALTGPMGVVGGIGAAVGAFYSFKRVVIDTAQEISNFAKLSQQLGIGTEEIQKLKFVAGQTGVQFDDLTGALEEVNIRIGETIRDRTGPAAEAFQTLGINAQKLGEMAPVDRLTTLAGAIAKVRNEASRGFLADEIFGGDAFKIMGLLRQGSQGIEQLTGRAEKLGLVLDRHVVKSIHAATRAMDQMRQRSKGLGRQITAEIWPMLGLAVSDIERALGKVDQAGDKSLIQRIKDINRPIANLFPYGKLFESYGRRAQAQKAQFKAAEPVSGYEKYRGPRGGVSTADKIERQTKTMLDIERREQRRDQEHLRMLERMWQGQAPPIDRF